MAVSPAVCFASTANNETHQSFSTAADPVCAIHAKRLTQWNVWKSLKKHRDSGREFAAFFLVPNSAKSHCSSLWQNWALCF
jgi:hypothetical protein